MTLHVSSTPEEKRHWQMGGYWEASKRFAENFHVLGFEWDPTELRWYIDGTLLRTVQNPDWHQPLFLIFDSGTMPEWFGMPNDTDLPSTFTIEYVRAWRREGGEIIRLPAFLCGLRRCDTEFDPLAFCSQIAAPSDSDLIDTVQVELGVLVF